MTTRKKEWIINYIKNSPTGVVQSLDEEFVSCYIETFGASYIHSRTGIKRSTYLQKLLICLCEDGTLIKESKGISGAPNKYPRWTYEYRIAKE